MDEQSRENGIHELARQAKQGDRDAMARLLVAPAIKNVIYKTANDKVGPANADDIYQCVCERIWKKLDTWQEQATITSWVKRVTFNECVDFLRKTNPQTLIFTDTLPVSSQDPDQYTYILDREKKTILDEALQTLGKRCKQILTLFFEGREKHVIMQAVRLKKSTFYETFNRCCTILEQKIRKIL
jgi:RNA polymerase sigma factor (sigma-70 family)